MNKKLLLTLPIALMSFMAKPQQATAATVDIFHNDALAAVCKTNHTYRSQDLRSTDCDSTIPEDAIFAGYTRARHSDIVEFSVHLNGSEHAGQKLAISFDEISNRATTRIPDRINFLYNTKLKYDVSITGSSALEGAFASVDARFDVNPFPRIMSVFAEVTDFSAPTILSDFDSFLQPRTTPVISALQNITLTAFLPFDAQPDDFVTIRFTSRIQTVVPTPGSFLLLATAGLLLFLKRRRREAMV